MSNLQKGLVDVAKIILETTKKHSPQLIGYDKNNKCFIMCFPFFNDKDKELMRIKIKQFIIEKNIIKYYLIMETWISVKNKDELDMKNLVLPRYDKNRKEGLVVTEFDKGKNPKSKIIYFHRTESNAIVFGKESEFNEGKSIWNVWGEMD